MTVALLVALGLYGWATAAWWVAISVAAIAGASLFVRARVAFGSAGQRTISIAAAAVGVALALAREPDPGYGAGTLPTPAAVVAMAAFAMCAARAWMRAPERGAALTFALEIAGVAACGLTRLGAGYIVGALVFLGVGLAALRAEDGARVPASEQPPRVRVAAVVLAAIGLGIGVAIAAALPPLYDYTQSKFDVAYEFIGFKGELRLGALSDLKKSDEIVLRITGARTDYLRGAVYDHFEPSSSRWTLWNMDMRAVQLPVPRAPAGTTEIRRVGGWGERYFVPLRAGAIGASPRQALVDTAGVMRPAPGTRYDRYWFDESAPDELAASAPTPEDVRLPPSLRPTLEAILSEWTSPGDPPDVVLAKVARHFDADYKYSLSFARPAKDPIVDFLTTNKQGNCEYFASAAALLARAAKIPARVATGYRVAERNPLTGQYLVRQKNAHAWVEAWIDGAWRTIDPTPASRLEENLARDVSFARALGDVVAIAWGTLGNAYARLGPVELASAAGALTALFLVVRLIRARRDARGGVASRATTDDAPLPCLVRLLDALAKRGIVRAPSEPLARLARRLAEAELVDAASLIERYAALRYGGVGDADVLAREMDRTAVQLAR